MARHSNWLLLMQNTSTDVMCFYDGGLGFSEYRCLINPDSGTPYRTYYSFMMFNTLYTLKNQASCTLDGSGVFAGAAVKEKQAAIVLSNTTGDTVHVKLDLSGFPASYVQFLRIDEENRYTLTGETLEQNVAVIPPYGAVEIKLFDL